MMSHPTNTRKIHLYYQNTRGLKSKTKSLRLALLQNDYEIVLMTETWLGGDNCNITDAELFDERYSVFRRDRDKKTSLKCRGGGALIAIKNYKNWTSPKFTKITHQQDWQNESTEDIWISFYCGDVRVNICNVYLPPDINLESFKAFHQKVQRLCAENPDDIFLIGGDENAPNFVSHPMFFSAKEHIISDCFNMSNLDQFNTHQNDSGNVLDLMFSNRILKCTLCGDSLVKVDKAHPPFEIEMFLEGATSASTTYEPPQQFRNFRKANFKLIEKDLLKINWAETFAGTGDPNELLELYNAKIKEILDDHCPLRERKVHNYPQWISQNTIKALSTKMIYHKRWKRHKRLSDHEIFQRMRRETAEHLTEDYKKHMKKTETNVKSNIKEFWSFINSRKKNGSGLPEVMKLEEKIASTNSESAELFAEYFGSVYQDDDNNPLIPVEPNEPVLSEMWISMDKIFQKLRKIDANKATGPDSIPPLFYKRCAISLTHPLYILFNRSLTTGIFPTNWKLAHVVPILKSGAAFDVQNYRPISKLDIIGKVFESIVTDELFNKFQHIISPSQHGFFRGRSTTTNLIGYAEQLHRLMDEMGQMDVIYTDFSKAFDKVNHRMLLNKLHKVGICGKMLLWLESYITGRSQQVKVGSKISRVINVQSSVAQGSHLGPLLFLLFINEIKDIFDNVDHCEYADDLKFWRPIKSPEDCSILQAHLDKLQQFCMNHQMKLNVAKCKIVSYTKNTVRFIDSTYHINGECLERETSMKDLGVIFDSKLNYSQHIEMLHNTCLRTIGFIMRSCQDFKDPKTLIMLFNSLVRSKLEYCSVIWNPHNSTDIVKIERVQRKFVKQLFYRKLIPNSPPEWDYPTSCEILDITPLEHRRVINGLSFAVKSLRKISDSQQYIHLFTANSQPHNTRTSRDYILAKSRTEVGLNSPVNTLLSHLNLYCDGCDIYNSIFSTVMSQIRNNVTAQDSSP